jgi:hypothetical protein
MAAVSPLQPHKTLAITRPWLVEKKPGGRAMPSSSCPLIAVLLTSVGGRDQIPPRTFVWLPAGWRRMGSSRLFPPALWYTGKPPDLAARG